MTVSIAPIATGNNIQKGQPYAALAARFLAEIGANDNGVVHSNAATTQTGAGRTRVESRKSEKQSANA